LSIPKKLLRWQQKWEVDYGSYADENRKNEKETAPWDVAYEVGISDSRYSKIENGLTVPEDGLLEKIADVLGVAVDELK